MRDAEDIQEALAFLNDFAESMPAGSHMFLPGVHRVQVLHRGPGGWVRLYFDERSEASALGLAQLLLLPEPEPVAKLNFVAAFEGIPASPVGGLGEAVRGPRKPLPTMGSATDS